MEEAEAREIQKQHDAALDATMVSLLVQLEKRIAEVDDQMQDEAIKFGILERPEEYKVDALSVLAGMRAAFVQVREAVSKARAKHGDSIAT